MHDQFLAERLMSGDDRAFRQVVGEYGGRLARLARALSSGDEACDETMQETWYAVIRGIHGFTGRTSLRVWLFAILVNQARRVAARHHRHAAAPDDDVRESGMAAAGTWSEPPAPWELESAEPAVLERESLAALAAALPSLPETERLAVLLRDVEGLSADEARAVLGTGDDALRLHLHRGRARLRRALDRYLRYGVVAGRPALREECAR